MTSEQYVKNAVTTVKDFLRDNRDGYHLKTTAQELIPVSYKPELDISHELTAVLASHYCQLIRIPHWAVECGCVDIYLETAILSQYLSSPHEGHLEDVYLIFAYMKMHQKFCIIFNPKGVTIDKEVFPKV